MNITKKTEIYCIELLKNGKCKEFPFHNLTHTKEVVNNIKFISKAEGLDPKEIEPVLIAGWFHDIGFKIKYSNHEDYSKEIALKFLVDNKYEKHKIDVILSCIETTRMPQSPETNYGKIIADADLFHISTPDFFIENYF